MKKELLVINTLVFLDQMKSGTLQWELLEDIHKLNVSKVEIRREFIKEFSSELIQIKNKADEFGISLFYSVPDLLYKKEVLQFDTIENYFKESLTMGCKNVKMNIGEVEDINQEDVIRLNDLCEQYNVKFTVENDQTLEGGKVDKIKRFMNQFTKMGGKLTVTFDIGNWIWLEEDPINNAAILKEYVSYIHLKDVLGTDTPKLVLLNEGDVDWKNTLAHLPQDVPLALEYPCGRDVISQLAKEILKLEIEVNYG